MPKGEHGVSTAPERDLCINYMYELAVDPGRRGSLDEFENKTLYVLQELNATQNIQRILSDNMELIINLNLYVINSTSKDLQGPLHMRPIDRAGLASFRDLTLPLNPL